MHWMLTELVLKLAEVAIGPLKMAAVEMGPQSVEMTPLIDLQSPKH